MIQYDSYSQTDGALHSPLTKAAARRRQALSRKPGMLYINASNGMGFLTWHS